MADGDPDRLTQRDFSRLRIQEMSVAERAELKRRYAAFIRHFNDADTGEAEAERQVRKWVPGERG